MVNVQARPYDAFTVTFGMRAINVVARACTVSDAADASTATCDWAETDNGVSRSDRG